MGLAHQSVIEEKAAADEAAAVSRSEMITAERPARRMVAPYSEQQRVKHSLALDGRITGFACCVQAVRLMLSSVSTITDAEATAIRAAYERGGELAAPVELRQFFRGIDSNATARKLVRTIASWPLRHMGTPEAVHAKRRLRGSQAA